MEDSLMINDELLNIPFDQYQRYRVLKEIVEIIKNQTGERSLNILDVGGHSITMGGKPWLPIKEFLPEDKTFVTDMPFCNIPSYLKGSGERLPFKRGSFDIVTCQDVLEHIPSEKREEFIFNLIEAGRDYIIIGCPFYSENSALSEKIFFEYIKNKIGGEHYHLKEHITNGLPKIEDIEQILNRKRLEFSIIPSGYIYNWLLMNMIKVYISSIPDSLKLHTMVDRFYNMNFYESDQREPSYRNVIVISKKRDKKILECISEKFKALREKHKYFSLEKADFSQLQLLLNLEELKIKNTFNKLKEEISNLNGVLYEKEIVIRNLNKTVNDKENHIKNLERTLSEIKGSKLWKLFDSIRKSKKGIKIIIKEGPSSLINRIKMRNQDVYSIQDQYPLWLMKNSLSLSDITRIKAEVSTFKYKPIISIIMPVYNVDKAWLEKAIDSVLNQIYPHWELCIVDDASIRGHIRGILDYYSSIENRIKVKYLQQNQGIAGATNEALQLANGEFIGLLDNDDELSQDALFEVVKLLNEHPDADMIYSDEDKMTMNGTRCGPFFKPDWSPDLFFSSMYTCHFGIYRKTIVDKINGFRKGFEGSQDYDFVLRFIEETNKIYHIPKILYHWRKIPGSTAERYDVKNSDDASLKALSEAIKRRGIDGTVEIGLQMGGFRVKRRIINNPLVSIIIPTKDKLEFLMRCIDSIKRKTDYPNYEILIVDNKSIESATKDYLKSIDGKDRCRVISYNASFNFSAINNYAAKQSGGDFLLFLNNDTEVVSSEWVNAMLEFAQRKETGAVGAKLIYRNNTIQHAGILLGVGGIANHAFYQFPSSKDSYFSQADVIKNYSAITAACMMIRKSLFEEMQGFDEVNCPIAFNDVDLCLRLREKGYLNVYTPYAVLYHHEAASRGYKRDPEAEYIKKRWGHIIENDPYYNPNLSRDRFDFSLRI
jgi:GT2 family glycosyltransferase